MYFTGQYTRVRRNIKLHLDTTNLAVILLVFASVYIYMQTFIQMQKCIQKFVSKNHTKTHIFGLPLEIAYHPGIFAVLFPMYYKLGHTYPNLECYLV